MKKCSQIKGVTHLKAVVLLVALFVSWHNSAHPEGIKGNKKMKKLMFVLKVLDESKYTEYREKIRPLMEKLNIVFLNEYRIEKVVHT